MQVKEYWDRFYGEGKAPTMPSDFCGFIISQDLQGVKTCLDVGCGNGRDTFALSEKYETIGIDPSAAPWKDDGTMFVRNAEDTEFLAAEADLVYSRFSLHTIGLEASIRLIRASKRWFCAETRVIGDEPLLYKNHHRELIDEEALLTAATGMGFRVAYFCKGRGMARYMGEDPLVARMILERI